MSAATAPFLAIDIGNTRLKWALYDAARPGAALLARGAEFLDHIERLADGPWADLPSPSSMLGCVVAGDALRRRAEEQVVERFDCPPRWVMPALPRPASSTATTIPRASAPTAGSR